MDKGGTTKSGYIMAWLCFVSLWFCFPAHAFGEEGHALTCRVAWRALAPETKIWLKGILQSRRRSAFEAACTWPDGPGREHPAYSWLWPLHYVGVPLDAPAPARKDHCAKRGCILSALPRFHRTLMKPDATAGDQALALRMLVHLIADIHLPVHIAHSDGRGGTMTRVRVQSMTDASPSLSSDVLSSMVWNEHMLWDSGYLVAWMSDAKKQDEFLASLPAEAKASPMGPAQVQEWANESFAIAKRQELFATDQSTPISQAQVDAATGIVLGRIEKAGIRIAETLNDLAKTHAKPQRAPTEVQAPIRK